MFRTEVEKYRANIHVYILRWDLVSSFRVVQPAAAALSWTRALLDDDPLGYHQPSFQLSSGHPNLRCHGSELRRVFVKAHGLTQQRSLENQTCHRVLDGGSLENSPW